MALKTLTVTIDHKGRDKGKQYVLTEMSADRAEAWALQLMFAAMNAGVEIPEDIMYAGLAGVVELGFKGLARIPYDAAKPLLDEMMDCVQYKVAGGVTRPLGLEGDIEEVATRLYLRKEVMKLHISFFLDDAPSNGAIDPQAKVATS